MTRFIVLISLSFILSAAIYSQGNPRIKTKNFFTDPQGAAAAKEELKIAEKYYKKGHGTYDEALKHYLKVYKYNPGSPALNYKIGICYIWTSNKKEGLKYLLESDPSVSDFYYLALGRVYQYNLKFAEAKQAYSKYYDSLKGLKKHNAKKLIDQLKAECDVSAGLVKDSLPVFIINLGPVVNSYYDDYGAALSNDNDQLFFTSKRPKKEPGKRVSRFKFKERIFATNNNAIDSAAETATSIDALNGSVNTSVSGFDANEKRIFFYKGGTQSGRLLTAVYDNGWTKKKKLKKINHIAYQETTVSIDNNGVAYFVTNRRGGFGGKDIWMAKPKNHPFHYHKPKNLGNKVNTHFDEEGVFVSPDGNTLYFSSKGHKGMGGFDVYRSQRDSSGNWGEPVNMGYPINSPSDELFYRTTNDTMVAVYATIRADSYGGLDIYKIKKDPRIPFVLTGIVKDKNSGKTLKAKINIYDADTKELIQSASTDTATGEYSMGFEDKGNYVAEANVDDYKSIVKKIDCPAKRHSVVTLNFETEKLKHPVTVMGTVTDADNGLPVMASLTFTMVSKPDSIIARAVSNDSTGRYRASFEDRYDITVKAQAVNYFDKTDTLNIRSETGNVELALNNIKLKRSKIDYILSGKVLEQQNQQSVKAEVNLYRPGENKPFASTLSDSITGNYTLTADYHGPFMIEVSAKGYFYIFEVLNFPKGEKVLAKNFDLKKMNAGEKIVLKNILFNTGKATLKPGSFPTLDKLAELLKKNPDIKVEVSGHTDNVGSASYNKKLSKQRALAVKNYLVSKGIEQQRIVAVGYGFEQPVAGNTTPEGRAKNRRVEMKILYN